MHFCLKNCCILLISGEIITRILMIISRPNKTCLWLSISNGLEMEQLLNYSTQHNSSGRHEAAICTRVMRSGYHLLWSTEKKLRCLSVRYIFFPGARSLGSLYVPLPHPQMPLTQGVLSPNSLSKDPR